MRRGREIVGLPVIRLSTGKEIGVVTDLAWNHDQRKIKAICLDSGGVVCKAEQIPLGSIFFIGQDAVTVADDAKPGGGLGSKSDRSLDASTGVMVMTDHGQNLGTLQDLVCDDSGRSLIGYEVSGGLVEDFISGRNVLPADVILTWGPDTVLVREVEGKIFVKEET